MAQSPDVRLVRESKFRPLLDQHLPAAAEAAKLGGGSGSGIEEVSGTVTLDASGPAIREFWSTGATTFKANGVDTLISSATGTVWRRTGSGSWGYQTVPETWTTPAPSGGTTPTEPTLTQVTPAAPTFDDTADTYTIPSTTGVDYLVGGVVQTAGVKTYSDTDTDVIVTAQAKSGYTLTGTTSWVLAFTKKSVAPAPSYQSTALALAPKVFLTGADAQNLGTGGIVPEWQYGAPKGTGSALGGFPVSMRTSNASQPTVFDRGKVGMGSATSWSWSCIVRLNEYSSAGGQYLTGFQTGSGSPAGVLVGPTGGTPTPVITWVHGKGARTISTANPITAPQTFVYGAECDGTTLTAYINGSAVGTGPAVSQPLDGNFTTLMSSSPLTCSVDWAGLAMFNKAIGAEAHLQLAKDVGVA